MNPFNLRILWARGMKVRPPRLLATAVASVLLAVGGMAFMRIQRLIREIQVYTDIAHQRQSNGETGIELVWFLNTDTIGRRADSRKGEGPVEIGRFVKAELLKISPGALEAVEDMVSLEKEYQLWPFYLRKFIPKNGPLRPISPFNPKELRERANKADLADSDAVMRADFIRRTESFPNVKVVGQFSRVGFDSSRSIAAVNVTWVSLLDTGPPYYRGSLYILRREGGSWKFEKAITVWVS